MSVRSLKIIVTPDAQRDIREILAYTEMRWGRAQRLKYRAAIYSEFDQLASFPFKGRPRDEISTGLRSIPVDQHMIFYRVETDSITIHRITHSKSDITDELGLTKN